MQNNALKVNHADNVAIALVDIAAGEPLILDGKEILVTIDNIPYSHKVALIDLIAGDRVIKYGESIGEANRDIKKGQWIHSHNLGIGGELLG